MAEGQLATTLYKAAMDGYNGVSWWSRWECRLEVLQMLEAVHSLGVFGRLQFLLAYIGGRSGFPIVQGSEVGHHERI